jgi:hypothetical protein
MESNNMEPFAPRPGQRSSVCVQQSPPCGQSGGSRLLRHSHRVAGGEQQQQQRGGRVVSSCDVTGL